MNIPRVNADYDNDLVKQRNNILKEELKNTEPRNPSLERSGTEIQNFERKNNIIPTNNSNINEQLKKLRERVGNQMKRIFKYLLLMIMSIFCLNSCILGTAAAGTYLLGTMGTYYCAEYGCTPTSKLKEKDENGVKIFVEKKPSEVKNYFESIKKRELVKIKGGKNETFVINLPKNFVLKEMKTGYYLYDEEKKNRFFFNN